MDKKDIERVLKRYDIYVDWEKRRIKYRRDDIYLLSLNNLKHVINLLLDLIEKIDGRK